MQCTKRKVSKVEMKELENRVKVSGEREKLLQNSIDADQAEVGPEVLCYEPAMNFLKNIFDYPKYGESAENKIELKAKVLHDEIKAEYGLKWETFETTRLSKMRELREAINERNTAIVNRFDATL